LRQDLFSLWKKIVSGIVSTTETIKSVLKKIFHTVLAYFSSFLTFIKKRPLYEKLAQKWGEKNLQRFGLAWVGLIVLLTLKSCYSAFTHSPQLPGKKPVSVMTEAVRRGDVPVSIKALGTITAIDGVSVKTQIDGQLLKVVFKEGQVVKKGDLLAEIDQRPFEAQLIQYEGQLLRDQALLENAKLDLKRYQKLIKTDSVSRQVLDTQVSLVKQYEGTVKIDEGLIEGVKVNIEYCHIKTDIAGVVGLRQVNEGNFVQTTDTTPLTVINLLDPISVIFPIPEDDLVKLQGKIGPGSALVLDIFDRRDEKKLAHGKLIAIDSQIDTTTGTIRLRAEVENKDHHLYPNQFVNVRLSHDILKGTLIINAAAIQRGQKGTFVYVVDSTHKTAKVTPVTVKTEVDGIAAIDGAVQVDQHVVIQGAEKLSDGDPVVEKKPKKDKKQGAS
jgi:membrane fusion protein, multidrug efflux system